MSVFSEIKTAAKTARRDRTAEVEFRNAPDSIQKTLEFYEFASKQFRRGSVIAGGLAVEEAMRVNFSADNLAMAGIASGLGALAVLADRQATQAVAEEGELRHILEPVEIAIPPPAISPAA